MSRSIDLFIQCPKPIEDVASELGRIPDAEVKPGSLPGTWSFDAKGVHAELRAHPYIDDGELVLERFQYALSCRVANGTRLADSAEAALLRVVSESLRKAAVPSLLVHDLQYRDRPPSEETSAKVDAQSEAP